MEVFTPSFESKNLKTPEEEIAFLRSQLAEKERLLTSEQAVKETIQEYKEAPHQQILHKEYVLPKETSEAIVLELTPEEHDEKISSLLGIMQTHGVKNALTVLESMNNPHLQDDFERFLVQYI